MQFKPEVTMGTVITLISMLLMTGIAWGSLTMRVNAHDDQLKLIHATEDRIEKRVDAKLNMIDRRLERIESLLMDRR